MKKKRFSFLRQCGKRMDILPIASVIIFLLVLIGQFVGLAIVNRSGFTQWVKTVTGSDSIGQFMMMYSSFIGIWIVIILFMLIPRSNRPMLKAVGYSRRGNTVKGALIGLLLGFATNGFCILMSALMGDIKLSFGSFDPALFFGFLVAVCIQSGAEEVADRCGLYQMLRRRYRHPAVAIIGNSVLFGAMHLGNPGVGVIAIAQIVIVGLVFSLFVYYFDCFWAAVMMHTGWNFTQSIVFGLPNSGIVSDYSLFKLEAASARNGFFYNVNFGVEGSIGAVIVLILIGVVIFLIGRRKGERRDYWAEMEKECLEKVMQTGDATT